MAQLEENKYYQRALEFIKTHDLNALPLGRTEIDGDNLWVNIEKCKMRTVVIAHLEAHKKYIDIQIPLSGEEMYGVKPVSECESPVAEYNEEKDIIFYRDNFDKIEVRQPGEMIVFTPEDAHAPLIGVGTIKKAVFKIKVK